MNLSPIEWTDKTWNPVTGCTKVSAGCKNCYAERVFPRAYAKTGRQFTDVLCHPERLDQPLRWRTPTRIFVNSMSDLFHEDVPDEFIAAVFAITTAAMTHKFQILTKRPKRMLEWFQWIDSFGGICKYIRSNEGRAALRPIVGNSTISRIETDPSGRRYRSSSDPWAAAMNAAACFGPVLHNVWLGVSVEDQKTADERIPLLLETPAAVRFVSYEPALEAVDFRRWLTVTAQRDRMLDWLICGGESGSGARAFNIQWARDVIAQCKAAGVPVFMKQIGSRFLMGRRIDDDIENWPRWKELRFDNTVHGPTPLIPVDAKGGDPSEWPEDLRVREFPQ